ncbi:MAG: cysteine desulfurase [Rhodothermales bacterium]|nr:cysteine desulfurase [Rhodothermales bacterium]
MVIYLDYNATTPVAPEVLAAMLPFFADHFGNAASAHAPGWYAHEAVEAARADVAALVHAEASEVVFTGGATEALNLALRGTLEAYASKGRHLVAAATEHRAVLDTAAALERDGAVVTVVPVRPDGTLDPDRFADALRPDTVVAAAMAANNETGVLHDLAPLAEACRRRGVLFLVDATQAAGKIPVDFAHADVLALSAHKLYGPKGIGALIVRRRGPRVALVEQMTGGGHERGRRSGTLNVPGIVGFGAAARLAANRLDDEAARLAAMLDAMERRLVDETGATVNGAGAPRLPNTLNLAFPGVSAERLLSRLSGRLALATGSACSSASKQPSYVLTAMGVSPDVARSSVRISLGAPTTNDDAETATALLVDAVRAERAL